MSAAGRFRVPAALFVLALASFLPGLLSPRDFAAGDEARYAEVLREMFEGGRWMVPHLNGHAYSDKPPVYFWLAALTSRLAGGITPFSFMLITWLAAAASIVVTYRFGARLYGERAGRFAALVLMSTFLFAGCAQIVRMDMPMSLFIALAIAAFHRGAVESRRGAYYLFYVFVSLAVLFKGPLGFLIPFLAAAGFLAQRRRWGELRRFAVHPGLLVFVLLVGAWLGAAWCAGERDFLRDIWVRQVVGRAVTSSVQRQPFYFYAVLLPFVLLPWSAFLYRAIRHGVREQDDGARLLLWWFAGGTAVISAISGKLFIYLLPMVPPAAILVGRFLAAAPQEDAAARRAWRIEGSIAAGLTFGGAALLPFAAARFAALPRYLPWPMAALFLAVAAFAVLCVWRQRLRPFIATAAAGLLLFSLCALQVLVPLVGDAMSDRRLAEDLARRAVAGEAIATYHLQRGMCSFYAGRVPPALTEDQLAAHLAQPAGVLALPQREFTKRRAGLGEGVEILAAYDIVGRTYVIAGRRRTP